ncbi:MAG: hypothetical protein DMF63_10730 [Acidobacteria bacterium]|nr:MAG: hypothetical protein DMF63_10730 [Acidobacteriota bacterium]
MLKSKISCILVLLTILSMNGQGQWLPKPILIDEHRSLPCDDLMSRWDAFYMELNDNPNSTGFIVIANRAEKRRESVLRQLWIERYTRYRGFDLSRIKIVRTLSDADLRISYWRVPTGASEPTVSVDASYEIPRTLKPFLFGSSDFPDMPECSEIDDGRILARFLTANPSSRANLVFRARSIQRAGKEAAEVVSNLVKQYGVSRSRIRVFLRRDRSQPDQYPMSEYWFLP